MRYNRTVEIHVDLNYTVYYTINLMLIGATELCLTLFYGKIIICQTPNKTKSTYEYVGVEVHLCFNYPLNNQLYNFAKLLVAKNV